jgi:hypothetical protein
MHIALATGPPQPSTSSLTYLVIGDGTGGSGVIEAVVDLSGLSLAGGGLFLAAESTFTMGTPDSRLPSEGRGAADEHTHYLMMRARIDKNPTRLSGGVSGCEVG